MYQGDNVHLAGFEQGINLLVETPFVIGAVVAVFLNAIMPRDRRDSALSPLGHGQVKNGADKAKEDDVS